MCVVHGPFGKKETVVNIISWIDIQDLIEKSRHACLHRFALVDMLFMIISSNPMMYTGHSTWQDCISNHKLTHYLNQHCSL